MYRSRHHGVRDAKKKKMRRSSSDQVASADGDLFMIYRDDLDGPSGWLAWVRLNVAVIGGPGIAAAFATQELRDRLAEDRTDCDCDIRDVRFVEDQYLAELAVHASRFEGSRREYVRNMDASLFGGVCLMAISCPIQRVAVSYSDFVGRLRAAMRNNALFNCWLVVILFIVSLAFAYSVWVEVESRMSSSPVTT